MIFKAVLSCDFTDFAVERGDTVIAVIDYDAGNLSSVEKALIHLNEPCIVTRDKAEILAADKLILPGVGAFGEAIDKLSSYGLIPVIKEAAAAGKPFLGICLGMQLMFECSEESLGVQGLGLLPGKIVRFKSSDGEASFGSAFKIPHVGWNSLDIREGSRLFRGLPNETYVYFVHSYYLKAEHESDVAAFARYGVNIHAAVEHGNLFGCQFHPEKSGSAGLTILKNFARL